MQTANKNRAGVLVGAVIALVVAGLLSALGAVALGVDSERDSSGFISSGTTTYSDPGYALATRSYTSGTLRPTRLLGDVRVQVHSHKRVFVGIARSSDVESYLRGVRRTYVSGVDQNHIRSRAGNGVMPGDPASQPIWVASTTGRGVQNLTWHARSGHWRAVVMNADGSERVDAGIALGAELPHLERAGIVGLVAGLILAGMGVATLRFRTPSRS